MRRRELLAGVGLLGLSGCLSGSSGTQSSPSPASGEEAAQNTGRYGLPSCEDSGHSIKILNAAMTVETRMRPDGEGGLNRTPHPIIRGSIRNVGATELGISMEGFFWANGQELESIAVPVNEAGQQLYYMLQGGEQINFELETDTKSEPTRFEIQIKTLEASIAERAEIQQWIEADNNGCV